MQLKKYAAVLLMIWTMTVLASLLWNLDTVKQNMLNSAYIQANIIFEKDILYRRWSAGHGGVYVPVTDQTPPNPYLEGIVEERDITTPSGRQLTLLNPAYMTRQVYELTQIASGVRGHITSLNPIRPENAADPWEVKALNLFERGMSEVSSVEKIRGIDYFRLMRPLMTEDRCLKCHSAQGYKVGDIRGGISVSVPLQPVLTIANKQELVLFIAHAIFWLVGFCGLVIGIFMISGSERKRLRSDLKTIQAGVEWKETFDAISDLVSVHDTNLVILKVNQAFADFFGMRPEDLIGKHCYEIVHKLDEPILGCPHKEMIEVKKTITNEIYDSNLDAYFSVTVSPIFENGILKSSVHYIKDITATKKAEEKLKAHTEELERINKAFVGRELKMKELKKEIEELKKKSR